MRKLASVREIKEIRPIPKADLLELAIIDGWQAVVKNGEFIPGDRVVYCEIDSFLPIRPEYEFLRKSCYRKLADESEGFRIRTIKLRGQLSQGLVLPLADSSWQVGDDVTEMLGVTKYDPTAGRVAMNADIKGGFPSFIPRTDEERIQNLTSQLPELSQRTYTVTEKLDGSSFTCYWNEGVFGVCSRNYELADVPGVLYWRLAREYELESKVRTGNFAVQGEVIGAKIQGGKYKIEKPQLFVFNVFDIDKQQYMSQYDAEEIATLLGLEYVPVIYEKFRLPETLEDILKLSEGKSELQPATEREGLVFVSDEGERVSFKAISNRFLLKED